MKKIKVKLSLQELKKLSNKIDEIKKEIPNCNKKAMRALAEYARQEIETNIANTPFKDGNDDISTFIREENNKIIVGMRGSQAIYDEFGTGTKGQQSPHPLKGKMGSKGYNTGKTIRTNNNPNGTASQLGIGQGEKYWTYYDNGIKVYTTGIPAGMQVFNAAQSSKKEKQRIVKKEVGEVLSKL